MKKLSRKKIAEVKAELETLEQARDKCNDSGILKTIDSWIQQNNEKLGICNHQWEEQPGEPPQDVCISCGEVRE